MDSDEFGNPEPKRVRLSETSEDKLEAYAREIAVRAADASGIFAGALGKARGHVLRLALVLEYLWWCALPGRYEPPTISDDAVLAATGLVGSYFIPMAERVCGDAAIPVAERNAMTLARHLRKSGRTEFNAREVRREIGGSLREAAAMDAACDALVEAELIRRRFSRAGTTAGRTVPWEAHGKHVEAKRTRPISFGRV
jgi:hypothetical protein